MANGMGDYDPFADPTKSKNDAGGEGNKGGDDKPKTPDPTPGDQQAAIDEANRRAAAAEAERDKDRRDYEQKLEQVTETLAGRYEQKQQKQDPEKPALTDADLDKAPLETTRYVAREEVAEGLREVSQHFGAVVGNLTEQAFEGQMEGLRSERFFKYIEKDVREFFEKNPSGKVAPKAARTIYNQFVGDRISELLEKEQKDQDQIQTERDDLTRRRIVRPDVRDEGAPRSPAPTAPRVPAGDEPRLDEGERKVFEIYKRYGVFEDEKDWDSWKGALGIAPREDIPRDYAEAGR